MKTCGRWIQPVEFLTTRTSPSSWCFGRTARFYEYHHHLDINLNVAEKFRNQHQILIVLEDYFQGRIRLGAPSWLCKIAMMFCTIITNGGYNLWIVPRGLQEGSTISWFRISWNKLSSNLKDNFITLFKAISERWYFSVADLLQLRPPVKDQNTHINHWHPYRFLISPPPPPRNNCPEPEAAHPSQRNLPIMYLMVPINRNTSNLLAKFRSLHLCFLRCLH